MPIIRRKTIPKIGKMKAKYKIGDVIRAHLTRAHNEKPAVCKITHVTDHRGWIRPYEQMYVVDECAEELFSSGCHGIAILENDIVELLKSKKMIRTVDIIDEVIEFCITDRFKERGNGIASIRDIEPKTLIRLRAAILIEVADIRMSRAAVMIGMSPASLWMWIKRKMGEYKHDKELAKSRYECLQRKYNLKPDYDYLMLVPRAEPTKHDEQDTRPTKFLDMEVSAKEVAAMADAMSSAVAFMERYGRGQRLGETQGLHRLIKAWNYDRD